MTVVFYGLRDEVSEVDFDAGRCPLSKGADSAARNHEGDWLAGGWVQKSFLLQVWHLATLGFDVTVADIARCKRRFASNHADLAHRVGELRCRNPT